MAYIDQSYYDDTFKGIPAEPGEFPRMAERASELVDMATQFRPQQQTLSDFQMSQVKKAVATQVEHYVTQGGYQASKEESGLGSVGIGSFNFSYGVPDGNKGSASGADDLTKRAINHLVPTGLLYRGVAVNHDRWYGGRV